MSKIIRFADFVRLLIFMLGLSSCSIDSSVISRPQVKSVRVNDGNDTYLSNSLVKLEVRVIDTLRPIAQIGVLEVADGAKCEYSFQAPWNSHSEQATWYPYSESGSYLYQIKNLGTQKLCVWATNDLDQKSEIVENDGKGVEGVNTKTVVNDVDSPPDIYNISLINANPASPHFNTEKIEDGDLVTIKATVEDALDLPSNPLEIFLTFDGTTFSQPVELSAVSVGTPTAGVKKWEVEYSGFTYSSNDPARLKFVATDASGNKTIRFSNYINGGKWKIYAGDESNGVDGSALSAKLQAPKERLNFVHMTSEGDLFFLDKTGLLKIPQTTGIVELVLKYDAVEVGVPGTVGGSTRILSATNLTGDDQFLYILGGTKIYRYDIVSEEIDIYAGENPTSFTATDPKDLTIWAFGAIALDPDTKDIYLLNACSVAASSSAVDSVRIQKITQDPGTTQAASVVPFAGNCVKDDNFVEGDPLLTPLENTPIREQHAGLVFSSKTKTLYTRFKNQPIFMIRNNVLKAFSANADSIALVESEDRLYLTSAEYGDPRAVYFLDLNKDDLAQTPELYIANESVCTSVSCRQDRIERTSAGVEPLALFVANSRLGIVDGSSTALRLRVIDKILKKEIILTIAGTDRLSGFGRDPLSARFSYIRHVRNIESNVGGFESGIHFLDSGASYFARIEEGATRNYLRSVFGAGVSRHPTANTNLSTDNFLGMVNLVNFVEISPTGRMFWNSFRYLFTLDTADSTKKAEYLLDASLLDASQNRIPTYLMVSGDYTGTSAIYEPNQMRAGMRADSDNNLFMGGYDGGGYSYGGNYASLILVREAGGTFKRVVGGWNSAISADCVTPGCAINQQVFCHSGSDGSGSCIIGKIDERGATKKLYYSENNKIRVVNDPLDSAQSTLGSLIPGLAHHVGAFVYTYVNGTDPDLDKVYYISAPGGNNGKLYSCTMQPGPNCNQISLGPDLLGVELSPASLEIGSDGKLYMLNKARNQIIEYDPAAL